MPATPADLQLTPSVTPRGHLVLVEHGEAPALERTLCERIRHAFDRGAGHGLLRLGAAEIGQVLPPVFAYWRQLGSRFVTAICTRPDPDEAPIELPPPPEDLDTLARAAPPMPGAEYLTADVLRALWAELGGAFARELAESGLALEDFLRSLNPAWNLVGRVHFNLAENRKDEQAPFAFLATYTHRLSGHGKAQHLPLGQALREYAGADNRAKLLSLLLPVQRAAERCSWLKEMVDAGEIFHPLRWSPQEAFRLLGDVPDLERAGVVVRMPATWRTGRPSRPQVTATVGSASASAMGAGEVTSDSTEDYDRGEKLSHYKQIPSLAAMLFVSHRRPQVTVIERTAEGWRQSEYRAGDQVVIDRPRVGFAVDELYAGIVLDRGA